MSALPHIPNPTSRHGIPYRKRPIAEVMSAIETLFVTQAQGLLEAAERGDGLSERDLMLLDLAGSTLFYLELFDNITEAAEGYVSAIQHDNLDQWQPEGRPN